MSDISTNISRVFRSLIVSRGHKPPLYINTEGFVKLCPKSQGDPTKISMTVTSICPVRAQSCFLFGQLLDGLILSYFCGKLCFQRHFVFTTVRILFWE